MINEEQNTTNEITPRPFMEIPKLWLRLFQMSEDFFAKEIFHTSARNTFSAVVVCAIIATSFNVLRSLLVSGINYLFGTTTQLEFSVLDIFLYTCCVGMIAIPASFYLNIGINYLSALIFGGKGKFESQAYLGSLYFVPLNLISTVLGLVTLIPIMGSYLLIAITFGVVVANVFFTVRVFKVVHGFSTGRAVAAVLAPFVLLLIVPLCMIVLLMLMGPAIGDVFSQINASLNTPLP